MLAIRQLNRPLLLALLAVCATVQAKDKLHIVGLFKGKAVVEVNGKQRVLTVGTASPEGLRLIASDSQAAVIEMDGKQATYALGGHIGNRFTKAAAKVTVRILPDAAGMYSADGYINGLPAHFMVDTGATLIAMNRNEARRLGIDFRIAGTESTSTTASGIVRTFHVMLNKVRVGDIELHDVPASVVDRDFPTQTLLGNSFLNRVNLMRDGVVLELRNK
ncbi:MAG: retropepsin-like aspartic protease family protein [Gammaproteobacteria bacterium]